MTAPNPRFAKMIVADAVKSLADFDFGDDFEIDDSIDFCQIQVEGGAADGLRYRYDGQGDPTVDDGMLLKTSDPSQVIEGASRLRDLRFIRNGANSVTVSVTIDRLDR